MDENLVINVKQRATEGDEPFAWGISFSPEFEAVEVEFHANISFEMKGYMFPRVDILEITGEEKVERMQVVVSKSLIGEYNHVNEGHHEFILKKGRKVLRLAEMVFIDPEEVPEELKEKLADLP